MTQDVLALRGQDMMGADGEKLGTIEEIYLDTGSNQPEWALITSGLFGKERVRLDKEAHTEERQVSETVRKEEIDVDDARGSR